MNTLATLFSWLADGYWPSAEPSAPGTVRSPRRAYAIQRLLALGDVADVHLASGEDERTDAVKPSYLLKVSRVPEGASLLDNERRTLVRLRNAAGSTTYRHYLPALVESFAARDRFPRRVNVFRVAPGLTGLQQVHERLPALEGRHIAWIFKRILTVLGFSHAQGLIHGAVLPPHILLHAANHGLCLVGWGQSVERGQRLSIVPRQYLDWYPREVHRKQPAQRATDIFLAARCMVYLAGGDPLGNWLPDTVPVPMQHFFASCLLEGARMRPDDAWALADEFDELLRRLYGPPKFHELTLT
jgi:serine/threonine protein kinase